MSNNKLPKKQGLYDPQYEHDACGVGFVVNKYGKKIPRDSIPSIDNFN